MRFNQITGLESWLQMSFYSNYYENTLVQCLDLLTEVNINFFRASKCLS